MLQVKEKLRHMGYELPAPVTPLANYIPASRAGISNVRQAEG